MLEISELLDMNSVEYIKYTAVCSNSNVPWKKGEPKNNWLEYLHGKCSQ